METMSRIYVYLLPFLIFLMVFERFFSYLSVHLVFVQLSKVDNGYKTKLKCTDISFRIGSWDPHNPILNLYSLKSSFYLLKSVQIIETCIFPIQKFNQPKIFIAINPLNDHSESTTSEFPYYHKRKVSFHSTSFKWKLNH